MNRQLPVPVEVDPDTGEWSVNGIPMILVPRHFLVNIQRAVEETLGHESSVDLFREPGARSAWEWCAEEAKTHGLSGAEVFCHYMKRLSQRGWAQFSVETLDVEAGYARVRVDHSVFAAEYGSETKRKVCYVFQGWMEGALGYVATTQGRFRSLRCQEIQCTAEAEAYCLFETQPE